LLFALPRRNRNRGSAIPAGPQVRNPRASFLPLVSRRQCAWRRRTCATRSRGSGGRPHDGATHRGIETEPDCTRRSPPPVPTSSRQRLGRSRCHRRTRLAARPSHLCLCGIRPCDRYRGDRRRRGSCLAHTARNRFRHHLPVRRTCDRCSGCRSDSPRSLRGLPSRDAQSGRRGGRPFPYRHPFQPRLEGTAFGSVAIEGDEHAQRG
jgi:hypothetical protein